MKWKTHIVPELPVLTSSGAQSLSYRSLSSMLGREGRSNPSNTGLGTDLLISLAELARRTGRIHEAFNLLSEATGRSHFEKDALGVSVWWMKANLLRQVGYYRSSLSALAVASRFNKVSGLPMGSAAIMAARAEVLRLSRNYDQAWTIHRSLEVFFLDRKDSRGVVWAKQGMAQMQFMLGNFNDSQILFSDSFRIAQEVNDRRSIAFALRGIANSLISKGKSEPADPMLKDALEIFQGLGYVIGEGHVWLSISNSAFAQRRFHEAVEALSKAEHLFSRSQHRLGLNLVRKAAAKMERERRYNLKCYVSCSC